jgi:5-methyltetrahydropteroyltriglutamate--homocysteine methyltransferase
MAGRPPFRADHVGSLVRPRRLIEARALHAAGGLDAAELRAVEDACIREAVARQEAVGLEAITDGEFRRTFFHVDFLRQLEGVSVGDGAPAASSRKDDATMVGCRPPSIRVTGRVRHKHAIAGADHDFLATCTERGVAKVCVPAPSMLHFRGGRQAISEDVYPDLDEFYAEFASAYAAEVRDLAARGCRYLQLDDTNLAYLCDDRIRAAARARGDDPDDLPRLYCSLINDAVRDRPPDMTLSLHLCRGNFKSAWVAQAGCEPVAEILLNELDVDAYLLEYDDERAGCFALLRFLPSGKTAVLGLMASRRSELEGHDQLRRRIDDAARAAPLEQLAISPRCGFASTAMDNELSEADQWRKLERLVEVARMIWPR